MFRIKGNLFANAYIGQISLVEISFSSVCFVRVDVGMVRIYSIRDIFVRVNLVDASWIRIVFIQVSLVGTILFYVTLARKFSPSQFKLIQFSQSNNSLK